MSDFDAMHGQEGPASEEGAGRSLGRDAAGLGLFALATLLGVSVFMSISNPAEEPRGTTALFTGLSALFGAWPLFALALALAFLGGRLWVAGVARGMAKHIAGFAGVALALSIVASAAVAGAGGTFGDWIGGGLSSVLTPFAGVPLALVLLAGVVWAVWLRTPGTKTPSPNVEKTAPRRAAPTDLGGLTADEAEALLPPRGAPSLARESQDGDGAAVQEAANVTGRSIQVAPDLKPLYPPDVRLQGGIPEGTRPLETRDQAQPLRARQPGRNSEPERAAPERPRASAESLGGSPAPATLQRAPEPYAPPPQRPAVADLAAAGPGLDAPGQHLKLPAGVSPLGEPRAAHGAVPLVAGAAPLPPSWESDEDDALEVEQDEVESGREPVAVAAVGIEDAVEDELDEADELEEQDLDVEDELEEDEHDEEDTEESEDSEELDEVELVAASADAADAADDEADADADDEEDEGEVEPSPIDATSKDDVLPPRPGWEQPGLFDEEPVDAYGTPTKLVDALRKSNEAAAVRLQAEPAEDEADEELDEEEELEAAAELDADAADELDAEEEGDELEDSEDEADEVLAEVDSDEEGSEDEESDDDSEEEDEEDEPSAASDEPEPEPEPEPEVILEPRRRARSPQPARAPRPAAARTSDVEVAAAAQATTVELDPESDLVFRAGALFIQRGRVAVSMLQRDFSLDFKQATALLDQLQEAGLIGPYLGGQRRDILLTLEEWRGRRIGTT